LPRPPRMTLGATGRGRRSRSARLRRLAGPRGSRRLESALLGINQSGKSKGGAPRNLQGRTPTACAGSLRMTCCNGSRRARRKSVASRRSVNRSTPKSWRRALRRTGCLRDPTTNGRCRRIADVADCGLGRLIRAGRGPSTAAGEGPLPTPKHAFVVVQADRRGGRTRCSTTAQIVVEGFALAVLVLERKGDRQRLEATMQARGSAISSRQGRGSP
jgi:hypothetical protein